MFQVVLFEPQIPPNAGNVIRLCANTGSELHLIEPLGFELDEPRLRRAGLDYREFARVHVHAGFEAFLAAAEPSRVLACTTRAEIPYHQVCFAPGDALLFGPETRGLPEGLLARIGPVNCLRIPMVAGNRSLNLSNAVAVVLYEAWRQQAFPDGA